MVGASESVVILVGGGHAAGKKTVCERIKSTVLETSPDIEVSILDLDSYINEADKKASGANKFDCSKLLEDVEKIESKSNAKKLILVAGLYSLYDKRLRSIASMKLFIDCDADTRLTRWITAEVLNAGVKLDVILDTYINRARPEFNEFIFPTKEFADVILPNDEETSAISLICDGIQPLFSLSTVSKSGKTLYPRYGDDSNDALNALNPQGENFDGQKSRFYDLT